jgi:hypothetical protein
MGGEDAPTKVAVEEAVAKGMTLGDANIATEGRRVGDAAEGSPEPPVGDVPGPSYDRSIRVRKRPWNPFSA